MTLETVFTEISGGLIIWVVLCLAATDVILGILYSLKSHRFKSSINKQGIINKTAIVISVVVFYILDLILGLGNVGFSELFGSTICFSELISVLYNLRALNVPFPDTVIKLLDRFSTEKK